MKKMLIALLVAVVSVTAMANVLVYDYKASIARLDVNLRKFKVNGTTINLDTADAKYDTLVGYVAIYACEKCNNSQMKASASTDPVNPAWIYVKRLGDKVAIKKAPKGWFRTPGVFAAAMFGPKAAYYDYNGVKVDTRNQSTRAWAYLAYAIGYPKSADPETGTMVPDGMKYSGEVYGFLGLGNLTSNYIHAGFGYVTYDPFQTDGDCGIINTDYCWKVYSIYGTLVATCKYTGKCGDYIFDICSLKPVADAIAYGTWSIKLNNKLSGAVDFTANDAVIAKTVAVANFFADEDSEGSAAPIEVSDVSGTTTNGILWK